MAPFNMREKINLDVLTLAGTDQIMSGPQTQTHKMHFCIPVCKFFAVFLCKHPVD